MTGEPVLLFMAAGQRFGVGLADVSRLLAQGPLLRVPFAAPALAGIMFADIDGPIPVFDLRALVDPSAVLHADDDAALTVVLFASQKGPVGLRLQRLLGSVALYAALDAAPSDVVVAGGLSATITGWARTDEHVFAFFSPDAFLAVVGV